jgi:hypothetical protein
MASRLGKELLEFKKRSFSGAKGEEEFLLKLKNA